ncbi:MAG: M6 family metalloprotease domain-containing protein [Coriobacteriia bacterium]|nr:M6 family metalloprotease domain-containing protein [Coriobacteriia bacterium]
MTYRAGAHARKRTTIMTAQHAWHVALCLTLAVLLAVLPLRGAYGLDVEDTQPVAVDVPAGDVVNPDVVEFAEGAPGEIPASDPEDPEGALETGETEGAVEAVDAAGDVASPDTATGEDAEGLEAQAASGDEDAAEDVSEPGEETLPADAENAVAPESEPTEPDMPSEQVAPAQLASGSSGTAPKATGSPASYKPVLEPVSGAISLLVVVAGFLGADGKGAVASEDSYDWGNTIFGSDDSVSAYYRDMSGDAFTFAPAVESSAYGVDGNTNKVDAINDGIVHVNLPEAHGDWRDEYYDDNVVAGAMLAAFSRVLVAADAYVNFASYDANGNGKLETNELAIAFVIAGYETALSGDGLPANARSIWAHAWSYSDAGLKGPTLDGVTADDYIAVGEKTYDTSGKKPRSVQEPISILVHELGHYLGLPDLYSTTSDDGRWSEHSVDATSLMADGELATVTDSKGRSVYKPVALDAWSRYELGWVKPTVVKKGGVYTVSAQGSKNGYSVLLVPTKNKGEYYLIENRTFSGHDAGLAGQYEDYKNGGIVIWHIDNGIVTRYLEGNQVNGGSHHPGVVPLYPEEDDYQFGYSLKYRASEPDTNYPFWTKSLFKELFPGATFLDLPLYGTKDKPTARTLSGIRIEFLTGPGEDMRIRILMPGEEESQQEPEEEPAKSVVAPVSYEPAPECASGAPCMPDTSDKLPYGAILAMLLSAAVAAFARQRMQAVHPKHVHDFM